MKNSDKNLWEDYTKNVVPIRSSKFLMPLNNIKKTTKYSQKSNILDLHNYKIQDAFVTFKDFIESHISMKSKKVLIITGKSGLIKQEFSYWILNNKHIKSYVLKNDGGAFDIKLTY